MTKKLKVLTIVGTRPEIIRLSETIKLLDEHTEHVLVHTGQNYDYELNEVFFSDLGIRKPDMFLGAAGETASETIAQVIHAQQFDYIFHYAALVGVQRTLDNPIMVLDDINGFQHILKLAVETKVKRVFYSSSSVPL